MAHPTPGTRPVRKLVRAPDEVIARIEQQVQPQVSLPRRIVSAAIPAIVFAWPPAFIVFVVATIAVPSATNEASVGATALWALQFAALIAITAMVQTLGLRATKPDEADTDTSTPRIAPRVAIQVLLTGVCASLVLALQALSASQIASLTMALIVVLHLLPMIVARVLQRLRRRGQASSSDPAP